MTKEELKEKIVGIVYKTIVFQEAKEFFGANYQILSKNIADALIEAGIGDVETTKKIGAHATAMAVLQAAKAEHRAEVAEMALELMARGECTFASPEYYKEQAEKELAEVEDEE